jgi:hypothetical protein
VRAGGASGPFSLGRRVPALTSDYEFVTGISSDRLTLFVFKGFVGNIFTRSSTNADFGNPNTPKPPPKIGGWGAQADPGLPCLGRHWVLRRVPQRRHLFPLSPVSAAHVGGTASTLARWRTRHVNFNDLAANRQNNGA